MGLPHQLLALTYKNYRLALRSPKTTLAHVILPALFVLILGLVQQGLKTTVVQTDPAPLTTLVSDAASGPGPNAKGGIGLPKCRVFDNPGGLYGAGVPRPDQSCKTIAYAPSNAFTDAVIALVAANNGLSLATDVLKFASKAEMQTYIINNPAAIGSGVLFRSPTTAAVPGPLPGDAAPPTVGIEVWYNSSVVGRVQAFVGDDPLAEASNRISTPLQVQRAVVEAVLGLHVGASAPQVKIDVRRFADITVTDSASQASRTLALYAPVFVYLGVGFSYILTMRLIAAEKDSNVLDALRMSGLSETAYWLSWFFYVAAQSLISCILIQIVGVATDSPTFSRVDQNVSFASLYAFFLSMQCLAMFTAAAVPSSKSAILVGILVFVIGLMLEVFLPTFPIFTLLYDPYLVPPPAVGAVHLYPPIVYAKIQADFALVTAAYVVAAGNTTVTKYGTYTAADYVDGAYRYSASFTPPTASLFNYSTCLGDAVSSLGASSAACFQLQNACDSSRNPNCASVQCSSQWSAALAGNEAGCKSSGGVFLKTNTTVATFVPGQGVVLNTAFGACACRFVGPSDQSLVLTLVGLCFLFSFLAWYVGQVVTYGHGAPQPPWFFLDPRYWFPSLTRLARSSFADAKWGTATDEDVLAEERRVRDGACDSAPLVVKGLVKVYGAAPWNTRAEAAVNGLSFSMQRGSCLVLLGQNGAGKTTSIKAMLGHTSITAGDVLVEGMSVRTNPAGTRNLVSVCPQHDILWPELSPMDHLRIFGVFQGMSLSDVSKEAAVALKAVRLADVKWNPAGGFSGGMKRRLSVAIAAIGPKSVLLLDEPTTGMDPANRMHVWRWIAELKQRKSVLLTTHSMEEAEYLGDTIAIMTRGGKLCAFGDTLRLKSRFGGGYRLNIITGADADSRGVSDAVMRLVPGAVPLAASTTGPNALGFELPGQATSSLPELFRWIEAGQGDGDNKGVIRDWNVQQVSLEDIFILLARANDPMLRGGNADSNAVPYAKAITGPGAGAPTASSSKPGGDKKPLIADEWMDDDAAAAARKRDLEAPVLPNSSSPATTNANANHSTDAAQFRALFLKDTRLLCRSKALLVCQLVFPIAMLCVIYGIKVWIESVTASYNTSGNAGSPNYGFPTSSPTVFVNRAQSDCEACMRSASNTYRSSAPGFAACMAANNQSYASCQFYGEIFGFKTLYASTYPPSVWAAWNSSWVPNHVFDPATELVPSNPVFAYCVSSDQNQYPCNDYLNQPATGYKVDPATWLGPHPVPVKASSTNAPSSVGVLAPWRVLVASGSPSVPASALGSMCPSAANVKPYVSPNASAILFYDSFKCSTSYTRTPTSDWSQQPVQTTAQAQALGSGAKPGCIPAELQPGATAQARAAINGLRQGLFGRYPTSLVESTAGQITTIPSAYSFNTTLVFSNFTATELLGTTGRLADCLSYGFQRFASNCYTCLFLSPDQPSRCCAGQATSVRNSAPTKSPTMPGSGSYNSGGNADFVATDGSALDSQTVRLDACLTSATGLFSTVEFCPESTFMAPADASAPPGTARVNSILLAAQKVSRDRSESWAAVEYPLTYDGAAAARKAVQDHFPDAAIVVRDLTLGSGAAVVDASIMSYFYPYSYFYQSQWNPYQSAAVTMAKPPSTSPLSQSSSSGDPAPKLFPLGLTLAVFGQPSNTYDFVGSAETVLFEGLATAVLRQATAAGANAPTSPFGSDPNPAVALGSRPFPVPLQPSGGSQNPFQFTDISVVMSDSLLPFATTMLLPLIAYNMVHEKELKLRVAMAISGLRTRVYLVERLVFDFLLVLAVHMVLFVVGLGMQLGFFSRAPGITIVLLVLWSFTLVTLALLLQTLFSRTRTSSIVLYLLVIASAVTSVMLMLILWSGTFSRATPPVGYFVWPPFAFYRAIHLLASSTYTSAQLNDPSNELHVCFSALAIEAFVMLFVALYLDAVLPLSLIHI